MPQLIDRLGPAEDIWTVIDAEQTGCGRQRALVCHGEHELQIIPAKLVHNCTGLRANLVNCK